MRTLHTMLFAGYAVDGGHIAFTLAYLIEQLLDELFFDGYVLLQLSDAAVVVAYVEVAVLVEEEIPHDKAHDEYQGQVAKDVLLKKYLYVFEFAHVTREGNIVRHKGSDKFSLTGDGGAD